MKRHQGHEPQVLAVGETLVDIVHRPGAPPRTYPGGSPANVALGLARLGHEVELLTWFGDDAHGTLVREHLEANGVRIAPGSQHASRTSTAQARIDSEGSATYDFDLEIDYPEHEAGEDAAVVHVGSLGAVLQPGAAKVATLLGGVRRHALLTYDPNLRPSIMGARDTVRSDVLELVAASDVVKVSDEDLEWLEPGASPQDVARNWASSGPAFVVVTLGAAGSFAVTADGVEAAVPAPRVDVADTVGAGDSFMGGLIDGLWTSGLVGRGRRDAIAALGAAALTGLLEQAARIAAITVSRPGADPPTRQELDRVVPE